MRTEIFRRFCMALDNSGQGYRFTASEYERRRDAIACFFYLVYEVTYQDKLRHDIDYTLVTKVARKYFNLLVYVFTNYLPELPVWPLVIWM